MTTGAISSSQIVTKQHNNTQSDSKRMKFFFIIQWQPSSQVFTLVCEATTPKALHILMGTCQTPRITLPIRIITKKLNSCAHDQMASRLAKIKQIGSGILKIFHSRCSLCNSSGIQSVARMTLSRAHTSSKTGDPINLKK